ncbi:hypothetical protein YC2023_068154 [Brassica napus]
MPQRETIRCLTTGLVFKKKVPLRFGAEKVAFECGVVSAFSTVDKHFKFKCLSIVPLKQGFKQGRTQDNGYGGTCPQLISLVQATKIIISPHCLSPASGSNLTLYQYLQPNCITYFSLNVNQTQVTVVTAATPLPIYQLNVGVLDYILLVFLVICYLQPNIYFEEICIKYDGNRCTAVKETMIGEEANKVAVPFEIHQIPAASL